MCWRAVPYAWLHKDTFCCTAKACQQYLWGAVVRRGKWSLWALQTLSIWGGLLSVFHYESNRKTPNTLGSISENKLSQKSPESLLPSFQAGKTRPSSLLGWVMRNHCHPGDRLDADITFILLGNSTLSSEARPNVSVCVCVGVCVRACATWETLTQGSPVKTMTQNKNVAESHWGLEQIIRLYPPSRRRVEFS